MLQNILDIFKNRRPFAALLITFFFTPVYGMLYLNRGREAIGYAIITAVVAAALLFLNLDVLPGITYADVFYSVLTVITIIGMVHAYFISRKFDTEAPMKWYSRWYSWTLTLFLVPLLAIMLIRGFVFEPFIVAASSMNPNYAKGDTFFVNKFAYGYGPYSVPLGQYLFKGEDRGDVIKRGDLAVFRHPNKPDVTYFKRIIGLPGDVVELVKGKISINGEAVTHMELPEPFVMQHDRGQITFSVILETLPNGVEYKIIDKGYSTLFDKTASYGVPEGHYFVMGDNRDFSLDSRFVELGFVPEENIVGKPVLFFQF